MDDLYHHDLYNMIIVLMLHLMHSDQYHIQIQYHHLSKFVVMQQNVHHHQVSHQQKLMVKK